MYEVDPEAMQRLVQSFNELSDAFIKFSLAMNEAAENMKKNQPKLATLFDH